MIFKYREVAIHEKKPTENYLIDGKSKNRNHN